MNKKILILIFVIVFLSVSTKTSASFLREDIISGFIFCPDKEITETPENYGMKYDDVWIDVSNKSKLYGWYVYADKPTTKHIIYLHGSKGNICLYLGGIQQLHKAGANILIIDYEGFGKSTGSGVIRNTILDSLAMYDYLIKDRKVKPENISLFGYSYGGAVAVELALQRTIHAILLESTFSSLQKIAISQYSPLVLPVMPKDLLNTISRIKEIKVPIIIAHAENDQIVPITNSIELYAAANKPKYYYVIKGAQHKDIFKFIKPEYVSLIKKVLVD